MTHLLCPDCSATNDVTAPRSRAVYSCVHPTGGACSAPLSTTLLTVQPRGAEPYVPAARVALRGGGRAVSAQTPPCRIPARTPARPTRCLNEEFCEIIHCLQNSPSVRKLRT